VEVPSLAGDFTAPLALSSDGMNDLALGIRAILNVGASADIKGVYLIEPFDRNRIPVLLLHGLMSSPLVWRNVATAAMENPIIRKNSSGAFYSAGMPSAVRHAHSRGIAVIRGLGVPAANPARRRTWWWSAIAWGIIARILATDRVINSGPPSQKPFDQVIGPKIARAPQLILGSGAWSKEVVFLRLRIAGHAWPCVICSLGRSWGCPPPSVQAVLSAVIDALGR
jgi:hypothetical protein